METETTIAETVEQTTPDVIILALIQGKTEILAAE